MYYKRRWLIESRWKRKKKKKEEEKGEKRFSQLWCDKNSILNWNTQYPRDSFKKFSNKQLTANGSRDESKSARVKTDRRSVARNQLKSGRETSIESLTGGEKKKGKKNRDVANARRCGKYGRHRFGNPATVCFPCPVESNRNTEKSRRSVALDLIKKSVVVKCTNLHAHAESERQIDHDGGWGRNNYRVAKIGQRSRGFERQ